MNLTPKSIILEAIKQKLKPYGVTKVFLLFSCVNDSYNLAVSNTESKSMKIEITEDEITKIKSLFINRIKKAWLKHYDIEPKDIIIQIDLNKDVKLEIFIQDFAEKVHKFDY